MQKRKRTEKMSKRNRKSLDRANQQRKRLHACTMFSTGFFILFHAHSILQADRSFVLLYA